jgi:SAM-dependent methyltransferase
MYSRSLYLHALTEPRFSPADVRAYYDANTDAFVRHGQGGALGAIHRAVWGPGVVTRERAFRYVEDLIAGEIDALALDRPAHLIDLGCGIGTSLLYLAQRRDLIGTGITLSPVQARHGEARISALGLSHRVRVREGDYCALPPDVGPADLAYAIESFVHGPSAERFFAEAARVLRPGGRLIVCDDVRQGSPNLAAARTIAQFTRGWHVNSLLTAAEWQQHAAHAGFVPISTVDLTPYLELSRPRDRVIALLARATGWMPHFSTRLAPLIGGSALQRAISKGWIAYHCASFRRA